MKKLLHKLLVLVYYVTCIVNKSLWLTKGCGKMAQAALNIIKKYELDASNMVLDAEKKAQNMIEEANNQAKIDIENAKNRCKTRVAREKAVATKKASVQTKQYKEQTFKLCKDLEKELSSKKKRAVFELTKFVIEQG